jgi:uncharacterized membrane protein
MLKEIFWKGFLIVWMLACVIVAAGVTYNWITLKTTCATDIFWLGWSVLTFALLVYVYVSSPDKQKK